MPSRNIGKPIQLRHSDDEDMEEDYNSDENEVGSEDEDTDAADAVDEDGVSDVEDTKSESEKSVENEEETDVREISFGALAKAQESFAPPSRSKKRKRVDTVESQEAEENGATGQEENYFGASTKGQGVKEGKHPDSRPNQPIHRSSKHAPTVLSSKHRVSRKRQVLEASATTKFRDPRFDAAIKSKSRTTTVNDQRATEQADKNYGFLTDYQASEILELKAQLKRISKGPSTEEAEEAKQKIKRQMMSLESKIRNVATRAKERDILHAHKQQEKQAIREGRKARPFFLKQSQLRKQIQDEKLEGMGKRARDKMEKRKVKKQLGKDGRDMPRFRRQ